MKVKVIWLMIKVLFVCHGNICRSPMAEYLFRQYVRERGAGDSFLIASAATSTEEIGNPVHWGTQVKLNSLGIDCSDKRARQMTRRDYAEYDFIIGMDRWNLKNMQRIVGRDDEKKLHLLLDFTKRAGEDIADPWYTRDFETTYRDIMEGIQGFWEMLEATTTSTALKAT